MDLIMDHSKAVEFVNMHGMDRFVRAIEAKAEKPFFSCSTDWMEDKKYICKLKGAQGDVIIRWKTA